ncbi:MAG: nucleoside deaminase, partial [Pseudomonadota bacterium]
EYKGKVFSHAHNKRIFKSDPTSHAEIDAIRKAAKKLGSWRLDNMTLYITCEPCLMCCGAAVHSRIKRVVYGCAEPKMGAVRSLCMVFDIDKAHHKPQYTGGVLEKECSQILSKFFKEIRKKKPRSN